MQGKGVSPAAGIFACCRPKWEALPVGADQRCVIRMEDMERELNGTWVTLPKEGHYTYPGPLVSNPGPEPYRKPGEARLSFGYFRRPFVVAGPGSRVIFTENHRYPQALIDRPKDSIRFL